MGAIGRTLSAEESIRLDRYILDHPDMKISEIAAAMGVWRGTVARHRRNLAGRGRTSRDLPKTERDYLERLLQRGEQPPGPQAQPQPAQPSLNP